MLLLSWALRLVLLGPLIIESSANKSEEACKDGTKANVFIQKAWHLSTDQRASGDISNFTTVNTLSLPEITSNAKEEPCVSSGWNRREFTVFGSTAVVLVLLSMFLFWQSYVVSNRSCILLGALSMVAFGVDNFIIAHAASYLCTPDVHMGMLFVMIGVSAIILHLVFACTSPTYASDFNSTISSSKTAFFYVVMTGVFIAGGEFFGNIGFSLDQEDSGPHQALVCVDAILVAAFFAVHSKETFTLHQIIGFTVILAGAVIMSGVFHWGEQPTSLNAFLWIAVSTCCYAASIITLRLSVIAGVPDRPRLVLIFGVMGVVGCGLFSQNDMVSAFKEYVDRPSLLAWPLINAIASNLGMVSVICAYEVPGPINTAVLTAVVDSNSIVLLLMNTALMSYKPPLEKLLGMGIIVAGTLQLAWAEHQSKADKDAVSSDQS